MNNSKIAIEKNPLTLETPIDRTPWLRERESELITIIESVGKVKESQEWSTLKKHVFDGVVENLERRMLTEAKKNAPDQLELARLNGQLIWAKKYSDLDTLSDVFRSELTNIRTQLKLHGKETPHDGA